jgi:hypothetical protein
MRLRSGLLFFVCTTLFFAACVSEAQQCMKPKRVKLSDPDSPLSFVSRNQKLGLYDNAGFLKDTRKEIDEYSQDSTCAAQLTQIACTIIPRKDFSYKENGGIYMLNRKVPTMAERMNICPDEQFANQLAPGTCSCFLTGDNEVTTAGHCFPGNTYGQKKKGCDQSYIVFGFDADTEAKGSKFSTDQVFSCNDIDANDKAPDSHKHLDVMRIRLNETASNRFRKPIDVEKMKALETPEKETDLCLIGSPLGAPLKVALGQVKAVNTFSYRGTPMTMIRSNMDGMQGASGSMVVDCKSGALVGIYLSGAEDLEYKKREKCKRPTFHSAKDVASGIAGENILWVGNIPKSKWGGAGKSSQAPGVK